MEDGFTFSSVRVVQALGVGDKPTARRLFDEILRPASHGDEILTVDYLEVTSSEELLCSLSNLAAEVKATNDHPILHIEAHGNEQGLCLPNGEILEWRPLAEVLSEINQSTGMNLLLVLGACKAAHFIQTLLPTKPSPVWALISPRVIIHEDKLLESFIVFYRELLDHRDGAVALRAMWKTNQMGIADFGFYGAKFLFSFVFSRYLTHCADDSEVRARANALMCRLVADYPELVDRRHAIVEDIERQIRDPSEHFEKFKAVFFMFQRFPRNKDRFDLSLDDCSRPGAQESAFN